MAVAVAGGGRPCLPVLDSVWALHTLYSRRIMRFLHELLAWQTAMEARGVIDPHNLDGGVCVSYNDRSACLIVTNEYIYINLGQGCLDENGVSRHLPPSHLPGGQHEVYGAGMFGRGAETYYFKARSEPGASSGRVRPAPSSDEVEEVSRLIDAFVALGRIPELFDQVFDAMKTMERKRWSQRSMDDWHTDPTWPNERLRTMERCAAMNNVVGRVPTLEHERPGSHRNFGNGTVDTHLTEPASDEEEGSAPAREAQMYSSWCGRL